VSSKKVALVSFPWKSYAPYKFISDMLKIMEVMDDNNILITGNTDRIDVNPKKTKIIDIGIRMHYLKDYKSSIFSATLWLVKCVLAQVKISWYLLKERNNINIVIFYLAYPYYLLPLIITRIINKKSIEIITRSHPKFPLAKIISLQDPILFRFLNGISPESDKLIEELKLIKYKHKLLPKSGRFIDLSNYVIKKSITQRENIIGYIGRLAKEKGVLNFVDAIPLVLHKKKDVEFFIGGDGILFEQIKNDCRNIMNKHDVKISLPGWIKQDLPERLNQLKILVLPSYSEGLPTIILEAMACGTPVLATSVGGIPDIISDGKNGFLMESNSPECISENIIKILDDPNLSIIAKNARVLIENEYTLEAAITRYKNMLESI